MQSASPQAAFLPRKAAETPPAGCRRSAPGECGQGQGFPDEAKMRTNVLPTTGRMLGPRRNAGEYPDGRLRFAHEEKRAA